MSAATDKPIDFAAHCDLVEAWIASRDRLAVRIETLLHAQRQPERYRRDRVRLAGLLEDVFCDAARVPAAAVVARGELVAAHAASGFRWRPMQELNNELLNPAELMLRVFFLWERTRWPGRDGRLRYAHVLFAIHCVRCLQLLSVRIWDADAAAAPGRLARLQALLDALQASSPPGQPVLVRTASWLIPLAQSAVTDALEPYFAVAANIAATLPAAAALEARLAHARMIGGHLASQIRHYCVNEGLTLDSAEITRRTRTSNALDFALLIQCLVPLCRAYLDAVSHGAAPARARLAGAILQAISPDPVVFVHQPALLAAYSMIEHVFIETSAGDQAALTAHGERHVGALADYASLMPRCIAPLLEDAPALRPAPGSFSPFGAIFGTPTNVLEDIALKAVQPEAVTTFSLEDVLTDGDAAGAKLAWVSGWRRLPHIPRDVQQRYAYPQDFAEAIFDRITAALQMGQGQASGGQQSSPANAEATPASLPPTGALLVPVSDAAMGEATAGAPGAAARLPARYMVTSDPALVAAGIAVACEEAALLRNRFEGHYLVSFATAGGWAAISKDVLTEVLAAGQRVAVAGLNGEAAAVLRLMAPTFCEPG